MRTRRILLTVFFCMLLIMGVFLVGESRDKGHFIVAMGTEPTTFDVHIAQDNNTQDAILCIFEGLAERGEDGSVLPKLATEWWVEQDNKTWVFKLREGVIFHDGTPFNADAVKINFERIIDPKTASPTRGAFTFVDRVEVVNNYEVKIITKEPYGPILDILTASNISMMSPTAIKKYGKDFGIHPVGTGPLMFDEWQRGIKVTFKKFKDYWGEETKVDKLELICVPEESTKIMMLELGEVDVIKGISPIQVNRLEKNKDINIVKKLGPRVIYIGMNQLHEPFNDIRVRKAIMHAIDRESIIEKVFQGNAVPCVGIFSTVIAHSALWLPTEYEYNPEKAKQLLAEAGFPNGFETTFTTPDGRYPGDRTVAEIVQGQLKEVGISSKLRVMEMGAYVQELLSKRNPRLFLLGCGCPPLDLDFLFTIIWHTGEPKNYTSYSNPRVDELIELQRKTVDYRKRGQIIYEIQRIIQEDATQAYIYYQYQIHGTRADVKGLRVNPNETIILTELYR